MVERGKEKEKVEKGRKRGEGWVRRKRRRFYFILIVLMLATALVSY